MRWGGGGGGGEEEEKGREGMWKEKGKGEVGWG